MLDLCPFATFVESPNRFVGRQGHDVIAFVEHIGQGSLAGLDSTFRDPINGGSPVSAHFGVGFEGDIHQYVKLNNGAWANGIVEHGNTMPASWPDSNTNFFTISVEHEGFTGQVFPEKMYQADLKLHGWLIGQTGIKPTNDTIVGHYRISPNTRPNCPGKSFYYARLIADLDPINWGHRRIFIDWAAARWDNKQVFGGAQGLTDFKAHLRALGCDPNNPTEYGWCC